MWGHAGTRSRWEILFSMPLPYPDGAGTNLWLLAVRLESSPMPLLLF